MIYLRLFNRRYEKAVAKATAFLCKDGLRLATEHAGHPLYRARANDQYQIPGLPAALDVGYDLRKGADVTAVYALLGQRVAQGLGGDANGVLLARGVDIGQHRLVDRAQLVDKVLKQRAGPGIGVRLEGADDALVVHQADRLQQRVQLVGMMGIIVIDVRAAVAALILEPAARAMEAGERGLRILAGNAEFPRHRAGGQRRLIAL